MYVCMCVRMHVCMHDDSFDYFESSLVSLARLLFTEISNQAVFDVAVLLTRFFVKCVCNIYDLHHVLEEFDLCCFIMDLCVCICIGVYVCVCKHACMYIRIQKTHTHMHTHTHTHKHTHKHTHTRKH